MNTRTHPAHVADLHGTRRAHTPTRRAHHQVANTVGVKYARAAQL
jgi:hypothetical protein